MGGKIRVLADASALGDSRATAGIGRYASSLLTELRRDDQVALHAVQPPGPPPRESWAVRFAWAQPYIGPAARLHRADLVQCLASDPALFWPLRRQVVTLHDVIPWAAETPRGGVTGRYLAMQRRRLRRVGAVIAVSQATADEAVNILDLDPARVTVVPEAVAQEFRAQAPEDEDSDRRHRAGAPDGRYLLWVGSTRAHDPRKDLDSLLAALKLSRHAGTPMLFAGATGTESERLAAAAAELGVRVLVAGFVADETLAALYRGAAAVVLPSRHEGFGLTALEALACGAPLIAARSANLPTLVGDSAILYAPGDVNALADAIDRVLDDPRLAADLRVRGPRTAARYSWRKSAELTVDVYRALLASR
ncbi:MAG: glycosyltransferase family 4 protein [Candidatus Dormibacteria bacterium]